MSKYMQLRTTVAAHYQNDLQDNYPNLARRLTTLAPDMVERNATLYEIAGQVDQLLYKFDTSFLREILLQHLDNLRNLYKKIEENIADWNLVQADKLLYQLEDVFEKIDSQLE